MRRRTADSPSYFPAFLIPNSSLLTFCSTLQASCKTLADQPQSRESAIYDPLPTILKLPLNLGIPARPTPNGVASARDDTTPSGLKMFFARVPRVGPYGPTTALRDDSPLGKKNCQHATTSHRAVLNPAHPIPNTKRSATTGCLESRRDSVPKRRVARHALPWNPT